MHILIEEIFCTLQSKHGDDVSDNLIKNTTSRAVIPVNMQVDRGIKTIVELCLAAED